jgi:hypothetical protein
LGNISLQYGHILQKLLTGSVRNFLNWRIRKLNVHTGNSILFGFPPTKKPWTMHISNMEKPLFDFFHMAVLDILTLREFPNCGSMTEVLKCFPSLVVPFRRLPERWK